MTIVANLLSKNPMPVMMLDLYLLQTRVSLRVGLLIVDTEGAICADVNVPAHRRGPATAATFREIMRMIVEEVDRYAALKFLHHVLQLLVHLDCCNTGMVLDLPYAWSTKSNKVEIAPKVCNSEPLFFVHSLKPA